MALALAHTTAGYLAYEVVRPPGSHRPALLLAAVALANGPDLDFLPGLAMGPAGADLRGLPHPLPAVAGAPLARALAGGAQTGRAPGAVCLALGVLGYRLAGRALGEALSPFIEPRAGGPLVTQGPYRCLRHPMYLAQAAIAVGAPLTLGCRLILVLVPLAVLVLALRVKLEDDALARTFPEYWRYAARTKRIVPFVF